MMQSEGTIWLKLKELWGAIQDQAMRFYWGLEGHSPAWLKLAVIALILFLIVWVTILYHRARYLDLERRAQQVRAQAAERNGLKLAPLGDNSMPDPRHGKDGNLWRNLALLIGLVVILGALTHRQFGGKPKGYVYGPTQIHAGPVYDPGPLYAPYAPPSTQTLWIEPPRREAPRVVQPASHRIIETSPLNQATAPPTATMPPAVAAILAGGGEASPSCGGRTISAGSTRFFIRSEASPASASGGAERFWSGFDTRRAAEALNYYENVDRPAMIAQFGARSQAAAYNGNNLAVALFYAGDCARAEGMFKEARGLAAALNMPRADQIRIDQNYAHFRALRALQGGG